MAANELHQAVEAYVTALKYNPVSEWEGGGGGGGREGGGGRGGGGVGGRGGGGEGGWGGGSDKRSICEPPCFIVHNTLHQCRDMQCMYILIGCEFHK